MATSLTRDPNFATALANAISGRILDLEKRWIYIIHTCIALDNIFVILLA
jgi:hypothetical protein